jgi:small subunit ribosomal protein S3
VIERKFVQDKTKELEVMDWLKKELGEMGYSRSELEKTPLGMKVIIYSFKPGMIVGRAGSNIERISKTLEKKFKLESPHIEVRDIENPDIDAQIMANKIAKQLSIYGVTKFKAIGHRNLSRMMESGAIGAEVIIAGRVPSSRARSWRFYAGYLPKCGQTAKEDVLVGFKEETMKMGVVGVTVKILPPNVRMPDRVEMIPTQEEAPVGEEAAEEIPVEAKEVGEKPKPAEEKQEEKPKPKKEKPKAAKKDKKPAKKDKKPTKKTTKKGKPKKESAKKKEKKK